jgi:hypothetical protein
MGEPMTKKVVRLWIAVLITTLLAAFMAAVPAMAAPVNAAQTGSHGSAAVLNSPAIQEQACTSGRATWVHMTINGSTRCFGYKGTFYFSGNSTGWFCSGNNYGTVRYWRGNDYLSLGFTNGTNTNLGGGDVTLLTINGWRGSNTC